MSTRRPLDELEETIAARASNPSESSYTSQLLAGGVQKIGAKVVEEAAEVVEAAADPGDAGREHLVREVGDLVYHLMVLMRHKNCSLSDLEAELARRFGVSGLEEKASRVKRPEVGGQGSDAKFNQIRRRVPELRPLTSHPPMSDNLRIGIPSKGRLAEAAAQLLVEAGLKFRRQERSLFARVRDMPIEVSFLRTDDIPVLCAEGAIDMGITGGDLIDENGVDVNSRLALGLGNWRLAICVPEDSQLRKPGDLADARIATSFPNVTQKYLDRHKVRAHIVRLTGSVEVMIALGVADAIVDLVETGSTLAANRLVVLDELGRYEATLIQNSATHHAQLADRVVRRLEGVVIARSYSLLEYNVPEAKLAEAEKITPGFESPTVNRLEEPGWFAVRAMVKRSEMIEIMERLEALGATAILETTITNCRL